MAVGKNYPSYVSVEPWIKNDLRVRSLSMIGRYVFEQLLTCPQQSKVPGLLLNAGPGALRDEFQVPESELLTAFEELERAGLVFADWKARVVYCRPLLADMSCNRPKSPSRAAAYGLVVHRLAQKCAVLDMVDEDIRALVIDSPSLHQSYLRCNALSTEDAERTREQPLARQQHQASFGFPERPEPAAAAADQAGEVVQPRLSVVAVDGVTQSYDEAEAALLAGAGDAMQELTPNERAQLRTAWLVARQAGWTVADMADVGEWVKAGKLYFVTRITKAAYVSSRLGECLEKMSQDRGQRMPKSPALQQHRAAAAEPTKRLQWVLGDRGSAKGRPTEVKDLVTGEVAISTLDTPEELAVLERARERSRGGEHVEVSQVAAELERARGGSMASTGELMQKLVSMSGGGQLASMSGGGK